MKDILTLVCALLAVPMAARPQLETGRLAINSKYSIVVPQSIGYNSFEGFRLGVGVSYEGEPWQWNAYVRHGFNDHRWKFGGHATRRLDADGRLRATTWAQSTVAATGSLHLYEPDASLLGAMAVSVMDVDRSGGLRLAVDATRSTAAAVGVRLSDVEPVVSYRFALTDSVAPDFRETAATVGIRQSLTFISAGSAVAVEASHAEGRYSGHRRFGYSRYICDIDVSTPELCTTLLAHRAGVHICAAAAEGSVPATRLYSALGFRKKVGIETDNTFATMRHTEFAASRMLNAFFSYRVMVSPVKVAYEPRYWPMCIPSVTLLAKVGWADAPAGFRSYGRGFSEVGFVVNVFPYVTRGELGVGFHRRIGHYRSGKGADNRAFCINVRLPMGP